MCLPKIKKGAWESNFLDAEVWESHFLRPYWGYFFVFLLILSKAKTSWWADGCPLHILLRRARRGPSSLCDSRSPACVGHVCGGRPVRGPLGAPRASGMRAGATHPWDPWSPACVGVCAWTVQSEGPSGPLIAPRAGGHSPRLRAARACALPHHTALEALLRQGLVLSRDPNPSLPAGAGHAALYTVGPHFLNNHVGAPPEHSQEAGLGGPHFCQHTEKGTK